MKSTLIIVVVMLLAVTTFGCSMRRVHQTANAASRSPNTVNINTATANELDRLPGIGRKTAEAIVEFRIENGPFRRVEHIMQIRGVSEKRFLEIRQSLRTE